MTIYNIKEVQMKINTESQGLVRIIDLEEDKTKEHADIHELRYNLKNYDKIYSGKKMPWDYNNE